MKGIVEFTGLPGSGKSTIARLVARDERLVSKVILMSSARRISLRNELYQQAVRFKITRLALWHLIELIGGRGKLYSSSSLQRTASFFFQHDELAEIIKLGLQGSTLSTDQRNLIYSWFIQEASDYLLIKRFFDKDAYVLWDEGFVHRALSYFAFPRGGGNHADLEKYCDMLPAPDVLCVVNTPIECAMHRVQLRDSWHIHNGQSQKWVNDYYNRMNEMIRVIIKCMRRRGVPVIDVPNTIDAVDVADKLSRELRQKLN